MGGDESAVGTAVCGTGLGDSSVQEIEVQFQAGDLGLTGDFEQGIVEHVEEGGQAADQGVQPGWMMLRLDEELYSEQLLDRKRTGDQPYIMTFSVQDLPDGEAGLTSCCGPEAQIMVAIILGIGVTAGLLAAAGAAGMLPPPGGEL